MKFVEMLKLHWMYRYPAKVISCLTRKPKPKQVLCSKCRKNEAECSVKGNLLCFSCVIKKDNDQQDEVEIEKLNELGG